MKDFHTAVSLCRFHLLLLQPGRIISPYPFSFKYIMVIVISLYYYNNCTIVKPIIYMQILHNAKMIKILVNLL